MAWQVYAGVFIASQIYHRLKQPPKPKPASEIEVARTDEGASVPLIYGRCRVREPALVWMSKPTAHADGGAVDIGNSTAGMPFLYCVNMLFALGIPFRGVSTNRLYRVWAGEYRLSGTATEANEGTPLELLTGNGGDENQSLPYPGPVVQRFDEESGRGLIGGKVEFLNGNANQQLVNPTDPWAPTTRAGVYMMDSVIGNVPHESEIPGYRGYMLAFLYNLVGYGWSIGTSPTPPAFTFEVSSYPGDSDAFNVGQEANPAKVLLDLLVGDFAKLGISIDQIDVDSFGSAKTRLYEEGNGYSRAIASTVDAAALIREILEQIDGVLFENPTTGKITLKLIRDDYDWSSLIGVTTENCDAIEGFAIGGWTGVINKIRVVYSSRRDDYREASAVAHNQANAVGQDGETREEVIQMPGVCTHTLAAELAARELAARSRPISKCRAIVDRTFYQTMPGDPIRVTWPEYGIDGRVFRVAAVNRGTLENGKIALDLIEDFFYTWRNVLVPGHPVEAFPNTTDSLIEDP